MLRLYYQRAAPRCRGLVTQARPGGKMAKIQIFFPALLLGLFLGSVASAQGTGEWTTGAPMPSERSEVAVAELDGKIYVIGGFGGQQELEIYDPAVDRWSRGAAIPRALHHAGAVGLNSKLYVIGGYANGWDPTDSVYEY